MEQGGEHSGGFTIIETLIVLAVTGFLLASAMYYISGRQATTQFHTSVNDFQQQLQQVINESMKGFPSGSSVVCTSAAGSGVVSFASSGSGCIFLGKVFQFGEGADPTVYDTFPAVGADLNASSVENTKLSDTNPEIAYNQGESTKLEAGFDTYLVYIGTDPAVVANHIGAFGVLAGNNIDGSFASQATGGTHLNSGSEPFSLYAVAGTSITDGSSISNSSGTLVSKFHNFTANVTPVSEVSICITNGNNMSALVTVGGVNNSLGVTTKIKSGNTCT